MNLKHNIVAGIAVALVALANVAAAEVAPSDVVYDEYGSIGVSLSGLPGDPANGKVVMANRSKGNCVACHEVSDMEEHDFQGNVGPSLDGAGERWTEADLRGIVANAKMTFDGSIMPAFYKTEGFIRVGDGYTGRAGTVITPILTAQEVEDVVAYLMTLTDE